MEDGATQVGLAWLIKEIFAFLVKWKKSESDDDSKNDSWKDYCREQFNELKNGFRALEQKVDILEDRIQDLKIDHRKCGGKD